MLGRRGTRTRRRREKGGLDAIFLLMVLGSISSGIHHPEENRRRHKDYAASPRIMMLPSAGVSAFCLLSPRPRPRPGLTLSPRWNIPRRSSSSSSSRIRSSSSDDTNDDNANTNTERPTIQIVESDFPGAGVPRPELLPEDIPSLLMQALQWNDFPTVDAGLQSMWAFSSDTTKFVFANNFTDFVHTAHQTREQFPTSFYGSAMEGQSWSVETPLNRVGGSNENDKDDDKDECWIATQVMKTISSDGRLRRWQWELRKQRRPPNLGCWYVESIGSSDRKGQFEAE